MNRQAKDVFNAILANSLDYPVSHKMATIETTDEAIKVSSQDTMHQMVVEAIVAAVKPFGLSFWVDHHYEDIIIRIY